MPGHIDPPFTFSIEGYRSRGITGMNGWEVTPRQCRRLFRRGLPWRLRLFADLSAGIREEAKPSLPVPGGTTALAVARVDINDPSYSD